MAPRGPSGSAACLAANTSRSGAGRAFVDDLSLETESSLSLEIPIGTVKSRLHNALNQLRADPLAPLLVFRGGKPTPAPVERLTARGH